MPVPPGSLPHPLPSAGLGVFILYLQCLVYSVAQTIKECACSVEDLSLFPRSGRSPEEGNGNPLQYSCLENPTDRGAWQATVYGIAKTPTRLSNSLSLLILKLILILIPKPILTSKTD